MVLRMVLRMARPVKRGGIYWLRGKVPDDLRPLVGKREEKFSLKTRDPTEAKILFAKAVAEIDERWSNLRHGRISLTQAGLGGGWRNLQRIRRRTRRQPREGTSEPPTSGEPSKKA